MSEHVQLMAVVVQVLLTAVISVFAFLAKRNLASADRRQDEQDARIRALEENTVNKEDFVRAEAISRQRQDKILDELAQMRGQNQMGVEIGAAIAAALNRENRR